MVTDPISDFLVRIQNAYRARKEVVEASYSNVKVAIAQMLTKNGYIESFEKDDAMKTIQVKLLYHDGSPALSGIKRVSRPGLRRYAQTQDLPKLYRGVGHLIISTPKGLRTHTEAKKEHLGGEVLCAVW